MSHTQEFGTLLKNIAHDYKNQLGIIETLVRDVKSGYQVDEDSCNDCLEAVRKIHSLSKVLQWGGLQLEEINHPSQDASSHIPRILSLLNQAIKEELNIRNFDKTNKEYILSTYSPEYGSFSQEEKIQCSNDIPFENILSLLFPYPKAGTGSTSRTLIALARVLMKITQVLELELKLSMAGKTDELFYSITILSETP
jgi:hypothetical protein